LAAGAAPAGGTEALDAELVELDELSVAELALDDDSACGAIEACEADEDEEVEEVESTVVRRFSR
jgi:hypothetical protein